MELIIRNNSGQPIYDQISGQIKAQILSGALSPGDALPSIRGLAKDLKISVIATKQPLPATVLISPWASSSS